MCEMYVLKNYLKLCGGKITGFGIENLEVRALGSWLLTVTQIFDIVSMSSGMGCVVTNVTVHI